ncbi:hydrogenase expression/formation protein HypE [Faecalitalea cylindroides]|uniref:hydrogenase expression/formation protein HypE n=1 Tax=Faecalitalea cylindroides TaxID=39483 RepID=UPI00195CA725|nr:hydrogenase expression/formation protein HypE [Faecalitalea cylindroides]MBM6810219.1 hydrogenase expression/formation protein HypE [Faecalitalea cylindroides]
MKNIITIDHGSGGQLTSQLIEDIIVPSFQNNALNELKDGAILINQEHPLVFSTDSFVVDPWNFSGGDIGKLAICGTNNDILMAGGIPKYLSCSLIIEEGFLLDDLKLILNSMKETAKACDIQIVTGDTKVIEKQKGNQIFINTSGIGFLKRKTSYSYKKEDVVIVSGSIARHGASIFMAREDIQLLGEVHSDCAPLNEQAKNAMDIEGLRIMRDPTRGGVATTCIELIEQTEFGMELYEQEIPIDLDVKTLCSLLGFDPLYLACEGRMLAICAKEDANKMCQALGQDAKIIGKIIKSHPKELHLKTKLGATRRLRKLSGQPLPRIC